MPGLDGDATFHQELTDKSKFLSANVAEKSNGFYEQDDLVLAPWFGNMFVVMDRNTMSPVSIDGQAYAFTYQDIFDGSSKFNKKYLDGAEWNNVLKERNEKMLKIIDDIDVPTINNIDDMNLYNQMQDDFKVVK